MQKSCITGQKIKFFIKDFFSKCDQLRSFLRIWSHLLKKSLMENFIFCAVHHEYMEIISMMNVSQGTKYASGLYGMNWPKIWVGSAKMEISLSIKIYNTWKRNLVRTTLLWWADSLRLTSPVRLVISELSHNWTLNYIWSRSSHRRCSRKKADLKNSVKFTGKHLCQSHFFNRVAGPRH